MADVIVSGLVRPMVQELTSLVTSEISSLWSFKSDLKKLKKKMIVIEAVVSDAEGRQSSEGAVKVWLQKLKDVVYEVDDLLDDVSTDDLRKKIENYPARKKVQHFFFSCSNPILRRFKYSNLIKDIKEKLGEITDGIRDFNFLVLPITGSEGGDRVREPTHSYVHKSRVIGRVQEKEEIIDRLSPSHCNDPLIVIPIVGIGGMGKTTLAKFVFGDERVTSKFGLLMWIHVSYNFSLAKIVENMLSLEDSGRGLPLQNLQERLRQKINGKKFLLVLDDVWDMNPEQWREIRDLLMVGLSGSAVMMTTRDHGIANMVGKPFKLEGLSDDDCWNLFAEWAFESGAVQRLHNLVPIGKIIAKRCGGMPLAATTLGGMLYKKVEEHDWLRVQDSKIWKLEGNRIMAILKLSYDELPLPIKICFAYTACCHSYHLSRGKLTQQWIAQGYINPTDNSQSLEDLADKYFDVLVSRSFFQHSYWIGDSLGNLFQVHELVHDLACLVSAGECLNISISDAANVNPDSVRHVSLFHRSDQLLETLVRFKKLRTLRYSSGYLGVNDMDRISSSLRVLDLSRTTFSNLPDSISGLKHLRYLDLSFNSIKKLPSSICTLYNLETLRINGGGIYKLPSDLWKLKKLRNLYASIGQESMAEGSISALVSLRILHLAPLRNLRSLPKDLHQLETLQTMVLGYCPNLGLSEDDFSGLKNLQSLTITCNHELIVVPSGLQATSLRSLHLIGCSGLKALPQWFGSFESLRRLSIESCNELKSLGIHLPRNLMKLRIRDCPELLLRCRRDGEDWPKIAHVQEIQLDSVLVDPTSN